MKRLRLELLLLLFGALVGATPALFLSNPLKPWALAVILPSALVLLILGTDAPRKVASRWHLETRAGVCLTPHDLVGLGTFFLGIAGELLFAGLVKHIWPNGFVHILKRPVVGIVADIAWNTQDVGSVATYTDISPETWAKLLQAEASKGGIPVRVVDARMDLPLDRYALLLNPYGGVYPDASSGSQDAVKTILEYVRARGTYINIGDVPCAWAYVPERNLRYPRFRVENRSSELLLIETPLSRKLWLRFYRPKGGPIQLPLVSRLDIE